MNLANFKKNAKSENRIKARCRETFKWVEAFCMADHYGVGRNGFEIWRDGEKNVIPAKEFYAKYEP